MTSAQLMPSRLRRALGLGAALACAWGLSGTSADAQPASPDPQEPPNWWEQAPQGQRRADQARRAEEPDRAPPSQQNWWEQRPQDPPRRDWWEQGGAAGGGSRGTGSEDRASPPPVPPPPGGADALPPPGGGAGLDVPQSGTGIPSGPPPSTDPSLVGKPDYVWSWRQVLAHPRIGGRLTAVTVDPKNPDHIYVGTEETTVLRSRDGGLTWREIEVRPRVKQDRQVLPRQPGLPRLGKKSKLGFTLFLDPPFRERPPDRIAPRVHNGFFQIKPSFLSVLFTPAASFAPRAFLADVARSRRYRTSPVRRIAACPGATIPLVVATRSEVLGSMDDGLTWIRLFRMPGRITVRRIECSPANPDFMLVATSFGLYWSEDGGVTFNQDLTAWPGRESTAVGFGAPDENGQSKIYSATGHFLYAGDLNADEGLQWVYPDFDNTATAPWMPIWWIEATEDGAIWLATEDGVRRSKDEGETWQNVARTLFSRQQAWQVQVGPNEQGGQRVTVLLRDCPITSGPIPFCRDSYIYASDDGGETWFPFFHGISRRGFRQIASAPTRAGVAPRWWVVTSGGLWATVGPEMRERKENILQHEAQWARDKLRKTRTVHESIQIALDRLDLSPDHENGMILRAKRRNWLPVVNAQLFTGNSVDPDRPTADPDTADRESVIVRDPIEDPFDLRRFRERVDREITYFFIQGTWILNKLDFVTEQLSPVRNELHELRRQVSFIMEDAWHERVLHLRRIGRGMTDPLEVLILKERIAALEAVLETWMDQPVTRPPDGRASPETPNPNAQASPRPAAHAHRAPNLLGTAHE